MTAPEVRAVMANVRGVVFDKDGTLIDLDARWAPVFTALITRLADSVGDRSLVEALSELLGIDGGQLVADGAAAVDSAAQIVGRVVAELVERGHEQSAAEEMVMTIALGLESAYGPVQPIGDVADSLTALRESGLQIGVATSDDRANTVAELADLALAAFVDTMRCADDGDAVKPDPVVLTSIAAEWGVGVHELVFVGDSRNDMDTARAAGCAFVARCAVNQVPAWADQADAVVADIAELVER